jgi:hypothetical protein
MGVLVSYPIASSALTINNGCKISGSFVIEGFPTAIVLHATMDRSKENAHGVGYFDGTSVAFTLSAMRK